MVKVHSISKSFGQVQALRNVSFELAPGHVLGLLGRNGAGKSTLLNIMAGAMHPDDGDVSVFGNSMVQDAIKAKRLTGFLPEVPPVYGEMTVHAFLRFCSELKGVVSKSQKAHIDEVASLTSIAEIMHRKIGNLSRGYRQRVGLAQALISAPKLLLLDEPTAGFDPSQAAAFRTLIRSLSKKHTIVFSSHILGEVQAICDSVLILHEGEVVYDQAKVPPEDARTRKLRLTALIAEEKLLPALRSISGVTRVLRQNTAVRGTEVIIEANAAVPLEEDLFVLLQGLQAPILLLAPVEQTIEEIFLRLSGTSNGRQSA